MAYEPIVLRRATARLHARRETRARSRALLQAQLYRDYPELSKLDAQLRGTMADLAELALSGDPDHAAKLETIKTRNLDLQARRADLLAQAGYAADALDDKPQCPKCRDTGWIGAQMCDCLKELCAQEQLKQLSDLLNLGEQSFDQARLDVYSDQPWQGQARSPRENMKRIFAVCEGYARQFETYPLKNLLFSGGTGLGKTFLSACIARAVSEGGHSVVYDTAINVFARFEAKKFARQAEEEREARDDARRYLNCDLMILDDLGSELTTPFVQSALNELVNSRLVSGRRTIISTNLSMDDIRARYSPQIGSRLEGEYQELTFYGDDIRLRPKF